MIEIWDIYDVEGQRSGKAARRGEALNEGDYHLVTAVWIKNSSGKFLISRRSDQKPEGGMLETVGGSALSGEDSIMASVREVQEELGIKLGRSELKFLSRERRPSDCSFILDIWLVERDVNLEEVICQDSEVEEVLWLERHEVMTLIEKGQFFNGNLHLKLFEQGLL